MPPVLRRSVLRLLALVALMALLTGCGSGAPGSGSAPSAGTPGHSGPAGRFMVVAAENFWGSIARQLAGDRANVSSIIVNPSTDPHSYQATAQDARSVAMANMVILTGIGYDRWMAQALAASPAGGRVVLTIGDALGLREGDNAHQWYSPTSLYRVVDRIVASYRQLDPGGAAYFDRQKHTFETRALARYNQLRQEIRARYSGVPIGYSESIFQPLAQDLGLKLLTPYAFAKAIAEGSEVTALDRRTVDRQTQNRLIKVWVYNSQNATPDVQRVNELARAQHIPTVTVTETLSPASATFEQWQVAQLERLIAALHTATGR